VEEPEKIEKTKKIDRVRHKPEDYYSAIFCSVCGDELFQEVQLVIRCPLGWNTLSKEGMRSALVKIKGAYWEAAHWTCGCNERRQTKAQIAALSEMHIKKPGKRWYKNMVPAKTDTRAINPDRPRKQRPRKPVERPTEI